MQNWAAGRVADTLEFSTETYGVGFQRAAAMEGGGNPHGLSDSEWKYYQYAKSQPNVRTNVRDARGNIHSFYFFFRASNSTRFLQAWRREKPWKQ